MLDFGLSVGFLGYYNNLNINFQNKDEFKYNFGEIFILNR